jgi:excisionase family DNA binding protein
MEMLTTSEVALLLGVSDQTVRNLIRSGALPGVRLSDESWYRVDKNKLIAYAAEKGLTLDWTMLSASKK